MCWSNTFSFGSLQSRSLSKFIFRLTRLEFVISIRLSRKHRHYKCCKTTEIQIIIKSTEPDQCVRWQTSGHHNNIVLNLIITSLEWFIFHCLFLITQLPAPAMYIIFLSLFILILSIIHVLWSASICAQLRVCGGFHAAADRLVPHTLHHVSQIIRDEERRKHGGSRRRMGFGWGAGDECAD